MIADLGYAVVVLAALECVLLVALVLLRVQLRRNQRRADQLRPAAELAIANYLAADVAVRPETQSAQRSIWRDVALEAMSDLRGSEQAGLARLLDELGYVGEATSDLKSRRRNVRRRGAETLAAIANAEALEALATGLHDRDVRVRMTCARALAEASGDQQVPEVAEAVIHDVRAVPGVVADIVLALGRQHPGALDRLLKPDAPAVVRSIALTVIGELRLAQYAPRLRETIGGDEGNLAAAARGLGLIGDVEAVPALIDLIENEDRDPVVRTAAVTALGSIGDPTAVSAIATLVRHDDWSLRTAAAQALAGLGRQGRLVLEQAAQSQAEQVREQAEAVLQS